jgi:hypothetical protein
MTEKAASGLRSPSPRTIASADPLAPAKCGAAPAPLYSARALCICASNDRDIARDDTARGTRLRPDRSPAGKGHEL